MFFQSRPDPPAGIIRHGITDGYGSVTVTKAGKGEGAQAAETFVGFPAVGDQRKKVTQ
jgi:hypothetical protein